MSFKGLWANSPAASLKENQTLSVCYSNSWWRCLPGLQRSVGSAWGSERFSWEPIVAGGRRSCCRWWCGTLDGIYILYPERCVLVRPVCHWSSCCFCTLPQGALQCSAGSCWSPQSPNLSCIHKVNKVCGYYLMIKFKSMLINVYWQLDKCYKD